MAKKIGGNSGPPKFNQILEDLLFTKIRQKLAPHKISPLLTRKFSFLEKLRFAESIRLIPDGYHMKKIIRGLTYVVAFIPME